MGFVGSYAWKIRQKIGHDLLLIPGSSVIVEREDGAVLMMQRQDTGKWCFIGGCAEEGLSHITTALAELQEEAGIIATEDQLIPYGSISDPKLYTLTYPSGDVIHAFSMGFILRGAELPNMLATNDAEEVGDLQFFSLAELPIEQMHVATLAEVDMYKKYLKTQKFQIL
jgi:8-oxo-dGTP pyrophosphatase MutT (NUDIX family)